MEPVRNARRRLRQQSDHSKPKEQGRHSFPLFFLPWVPNYRNTQTDHYPDKKRRDVEPKRVVAVSSLAVALAEPQKVAFRALSPNRMADTGEYSFYRRRPSMLPVVSALLIAAIFCLQRITSPRA